jgi:hypothetical protein
MPAKEGGEALSVVLRRHSVKIDGRTTSRAWRENDIQYLICSDNGSLQTLILVLQIALSI